MNIENNLKLSIEEVVLVLAAKRGNCWCDEDVKSIPPMQLQLAGRLSSDSDDCFEALKCKRNL